MFRFGISHNFCLVCVCVFDFIVASFNFSLLFLCCIIFATYLTQYNMLPYVGDVVSSKKTILQQFSQIQDNALLSLDFFEKKELLRIDGHYAIPNLKITK